MTKTEMITLIAECAEISRERAAATLDILFEHLATRIARGEAVRLPDLGAIEAFPTEARPGRNPRTGAVLDIPAGYRFTFRAGAALRQRTAASFAAARAEAAE